MINTNVIVIEIGQFYDPEFAKYVLYTQLDREQLIDCDNNLTHEFLQWLIENNYNDVVECYYHNRDYFKIDFYHGRNLNEITL